MGGHTHTQEQQTQIRERSRAEGPRGGGGREEGDGVPEVQVVLGLRDFLGDPRRVHGKQCHDAQQS